MNSKEVNANELSKFTKLSVISIISCGAVVVYLTFLIRYVFYEPVLLSLNLTNEQLGVLYGLFGTTALICYLPGGILADKFRVKHLATIGFSLSAVLTFWYSTLPDYNTLRIIFLLMGVTTTLIFWGIRYKAIRLVSDDVSYSKNIGISYGIVGVIGLVVNFISMGIFNAFTNMPQAFNMVLMFYGVLNIAFAVASFFLIPKFEGEIISNRKKIDFSEVFRAAKHPGVWLTTLSMFFVYTVYTSLSYTVPYIQSVFGASAATVAVMGNIRMYGISLFSSPLVGMMAAKMKSPAKMIMFCMGITAASLFILPLIPASASTIMVAILLIMILSFFLSGAYGVTSSLFTETKVPLEIFGSASGILSVIGFVPDMFVFPIAGKWLDQYGNKAYDFIFLSIAVSAVLAIGCAILVRKYYKNNVAIKMEEVTE